MLGKPTRFLFMDFVHSHTPSTARCKPGGFILVKLPEVRFRHDQLDVVFTYARWPPFYRPHASFRPTGSTLATVMELTFLQPQPLPLRDVMFMFSKVRLMQGLAGMQIGPPGEPAEPEKPRQTMSRISVQVVALQPPLD